MSTTTQAVQVITAVIGGLGGTTGIALIIKSLSPGERRRTAAEQQRIGVDAAQVISSTAVGLLESVERRTRALEQENQTLQGELAECRSQVRRLNT